MKLSLEKFTKSGSFKKYFENTLWLIVDKAFNLGVAFLVSIAVAKYLGPGNFGLISFAISIAAFFTTFSGLGLQSLLPRDLMQSADKDKVLGTAFTIRIMAALLSILLFLAVSSYISSDHLTIYLILIFISSSLFESLSILNSYFQSEVKSKFAAIAALLQTFSMALLKLFLIYKRASVIYFALVTLFGSFIYSMGILTAYNKNFGKVFNWKFDFSYAKKLLKDAWPLIFAGLVVFVYMKTDQIVIKYLLDNESVGQYSFAVRLVEVWYYIPMLLCNSLFPALVKGKESGEKIYMNRLQTLHDILFVIALLVAIFITCLGDNIVLMLVGTEFSEAGSVLKIYIWASIFVFLGIAGGQWYIIENLQKLGLVLNIIGAVTNLLLNFLLIPKYGIQGAAFATLVAQSIVCSFGCLFFKRTRILVRIQLNSLMLHHLYLRLRAYLQTTLERESKSVL